MERSELPKKILIIKDCTFILPDDFDGSVEQAFDAFLQYRSTSKKTPITVDHQDLFSTFDILLHSPINIRACGQSSVYQLIDDGYVLLDGTGVSTNGMV